MTTLKVKHTAEKWADHDPAGVRRTRAGGGAVPLPYWDGTPAFGCTSQSPSPAAGAKDKSVNRPVNQISFVCRWGSPEDGTHLVQFVEKPLRRQKHQRHHQYVCHVTLAIASISGTQVLPVWSSSWTLSFVCSGCPSPSDEPASKTWQGRASPIRTLLLRLVFN